MKAGIFKTKITELKDFGPDLRHLRLSFEPGTFFEFEEGQFVNILAHDAGQNKIVKRPYSIASPSIWAGGFDLSLKKVEGGFMSEYFWQKQLGDEIEIQGPLGRFTLHKPLPEKIIFVSTGTGVAPFRAMIHRLLAESTECEVWNIFGNRYETEILYQNEFEDLAEKHSNFHNIFTVSRPKNWQGEHEYVQNVLCKYVPSHENTHLYICGLTVMILAVQKTAHEIGFTKDQLFFEKYD